MFFLEIFPADRAETDDRGKVTFLVIMWLFSDLLMKNRPFLKSKSNFFCDDLSYTTKAKTQSGNIILWPGIKMWPNILIFGDKNWTYFSSLLLYNTPRKVY